MNTSIFARDEVPHYSHRQSPYLGATFASTARTEIDAGSHSLLPANDHSSHFCNVWQHRLRLAALLWMSTILTAVVGIVRREPPFDTALNHWDETAAYAALCCLIASFNQSIPV
jgi:hypothetical protein